MSKTLSQIREQARQRSDMLRSEFVEDSELNSYINDSYVELYDLLVSKFEDYYAKDPLPFTIDSGESVYTLPADFYKLLGVDRQVSGDDYYAVRPFSFLNRNRSNIANRLYGFFPNVGYRIYRDTLRITPVDNASGNYKLWYIPRYVPLVDDADEPDVMDWADYIVVDVARKMLDKEESDSSPMLQEKLLMKKRIEEIAANRDAGDTDRVQDISMANYDPFLTTYMGY